MKNLLIIFFASLTFLSCSNFFNREPEVVTFTYQDASGYSAISVMGVVKLANSEMVVDSNYITARGYDKDWESFPDTFDKEFGLLLDFEKLSDYEDGYFKTLLSRPDGTIIEKQFGKIQGRKTSKNYTLDIGVDPIKITEE